MRYNLCLLTFCPIIIVFIIFNVKICVTFGIGDIITTPVSPKCIQNVF